MHMRRWFLVLTLVLCAVRVSAHQVDTVEFEFLESDAGWVLEGDMDIAYMMLETRNVPGAPPFSRAEVMKAPPEELARIRKETENTLRSLLELNFAGETISWRIGFPDFEKEPFELPEEQMDWALLHVRIVAEPRAGPGDLVVRWHETEQAELIILIDEGDEPRIESVAPGGEMRLLTVEAGGEVEKAEPKVTTSWLWTGFRHVLPVGLDHILFILGLFLMAPKWKPLMIQSLLFTLAHSITLALAVFGHIDLPRKPVELLIAFSIAFVGIENLMISKLGMRRLALVFVFGLVHGLGFATGLAGMFGGLSARQLVGPLVGFNLGVEVAQITVLASAFLLWLPLRPWSGRARTAGSAAIALCGILWLVERSFS